MKPCEKCNGPTEWCSPPGWLECLHCGHKWWAAIVDPAFPELTPEEKAHLAEKVEVIFQLGNSSDRLTRLIELRKVTDEFSNQPISWLKKETEGKDFYSFGEMSREDARWKVFWAEDRGCHLEIKELDGKH